MEPEFQGSQRLTRHCRQTGLYRKVMFSTLHFLKGISRAWFVAAWPQ